MTAPTPDAPLRPEDVDRMIAECARVGLFAYPPIALWLVRTEQAAVALREVLTAPVVVTPGVPEPDVVIGVRAGHWLAAQPQPLTPERVAAAVAENAPHHRRRAAWKLANRRAWGRTLAHEYRYGRKPVWNRGPDGARVLTRGHLS